MRPHALAEALARARPPRRGPVGTTSSTSVDPVAEIAPLCAEAGAWLTWTRLRRAGDGLRGEPLGLRRRRAGRLARRQPAQVAFTPIDCSVLYTSRPDVLRDAFSIPEYLRASEEDVTNLMDYGPALGRRFRSLKLWAVIRCHGRDGLQA